MRKKRFVSKWQKVNTLELVADRIKPVEKQDTWLLDAKLRSSSALAALTSGTATREDINQLKAAHNMAIGLQRYDTGIEYRDITKASKEAITSLASRFAKTGRYVATGLEIKALQELLELHEAQLAICTVGDVQKAYEYVVNVSRTGDCTVMPTKFLGAEK